MEGLSDLETARPRSNSVVLREMDQMLGELDRPAEQHPSRPRSNSTINAEIEQMIAELRTREEEHHARVAEIRHSMPFFEADADLFRRAGILGSREAVRLQSMSRNAAARDPNSAPLTSAGKRFVEQLPVADENEYSDETSCGICMEDYGSTDDPESLARLPCGHLLGRRCIGRWLETCNTCPLCRRVLYEEDGESPAFLELQEILQRLGPAVTTLYLRIFDHLTYSDTSGPREPQRAGRIEETISSIEDVMDALTEAGGMQEAISRPNTSFGTDPSRAVTTTVANPEGADRVTEEELEDIWTYFTEVRPQYEALVERVVAYDSDTADGLLGPERDAELEQLHALWVRVAGNWEDARWDIMESYGDGVVMELLGPERRMEYRELAADIRAFDLWFFRHPNQEMREMREIREMNGDQFFRDQVFGNE